MITKNEVNYKIDWHAVSNTTDYPTSEASLKILADRKHYFDMLQRFLLDIKNLGQDRIDDIFERYNVHFIDIDDIPRVNIDEPK